MLTSCEFISNSFTYNNKTKEFIENLLNEDYDKCIDLFDMDNEMATNTNVDTMKIGLSNFRQVVIKNWGKDLNYTFLTAEKTFSTKGIQIVMDYFIQKGHKVLSFLPEYLFRSKESKQN